MRTKSTKKMANELECSFSAAPSAGRKTASGDSVCKGKTQKALKSVVTKGTIGV
jgi:hypothetical protein